MRSMVEGFFVVTVSQARKLRRVLSQPEVVLWRQLRLRTHGFKFRRQHPFGPFVFDFYCAAAALAIEIDSFAHDCGNRPTRDKRRDAWASARGVATLRIAANDVNEDLEAVISQIVNLCERRTPPPADAGPPPHESMGRTDG